jgi:hypothetical protein
MSVRRLAGFGVLASLATSCAANQGNAGTSPEENSSGGADMQASGGSVSMPGGGEAGRGQGGIQPGGMTPGSAGSNASGGSPGGMASGGQGTSGPAGDCPGTLLWSDGFESGDYQNWTSQTYGNDWGDDCQSNGISMERARSGTYSNRSEIVCQYTADVVHRGYGGLQFDGDQLVEAYTNTGTGTDAPFGVVTTFHRWLESGSVFDDKWLSIWTVNGSCDYTDRPLTLSIEDASDRLKAAHYWAADGDAEGSFEYVPDAPSFPRGQWVRVTLYINYYEGVLHIWQDGAEVAHVTFHRSGNTMCQWHWGVYASSINDDIVMFEDDLSIHKLNQAWTDFSTEPWLAEDPACQ